MQTANTPNKSSGELSVKLLTLKHLTASGKPGIPECLAAVSERDRYLSVE